MLIYILCIWLSKHSRTYFNASITIHAYKKVVTSNELKFGLSKYSLCVFVGMLNGSQFPFLFDYFRYFTIKVTLNRMFAMHVSLILWIDIFDMNDWCWIHCIFIKISTKLIWDRFTHQKWIESKWEKDWEWWTHFQFIDLRFTAHMYQATWTNWVDYERKTERKGNENTSMDG